MKGQKVHSRRFAARPPRRAPTSAPSVARSVGPPSVRPTFLSLFSFSVVLRCVAAKAAFSLLGRSVAVARSVDAGTQREGEAEGKRGERGSSQAAYQRNFLGVIDRPLPPLSRRPPPAFPLSPLFLSLPRSLSFPPPRPTTRAEPRTLRKNERFLSEYRQRKVQRAFRRGI